MSANVDLKQAERKAFRSAFQDGLWDIFIGCFILIFAIAPWLSEAGLGDFWSSMIFLPFWALIYLITWAIRRHVVVPRIGIVRFGRSRKTRMFQFNLIMFVVLLVGLLLGLLSALNPNVPGWVHTARFGLVLLLSFSVAAYFLDFAQLYLYGVLIALSPVVGEWLWTHAHIPHHGYPVTFSTTAAIIVLIGLVKFVRLLRAYPLPVEAP